MWCTDRYRKPKGKNMSESDAEFVAGLACDVAEELSKLTPGRLWVAERSEQFTAVFVESNGTKIYLKMVRRGATKRIEIGVDPVTLVPTELSPYVSLWEVDDPFTSVRSATNAAGIARRIVRDLLVDADSAAKVVAERVATYRAYCEARDALAEKIIAEYRLAGRPDSDVQIDKSDGACKLRG